MTIDMTHLAGWTGQVPSDRLVDQKIEQVLLDMFPAFSTSHLYGFTIRVEKKWQSKRLLP